MTRISSMFLATTLAILPIGAFAETTSAPAKTAAPVTGQMTTTGPVMAAPAAVVPGCSASGNVAPTGITKPAVTATTDAKSTDAKVAKPDVKSTDAKVAKPDVKTPAAGAKTDVHGSNPVKSHHAAAKHVVNTAPKA
jgi:hypothetical protein